MARITGGCFCGAIRYAFSASLCSPPTATAGTVSGPPVAATRSSSWCKRTPTSITGSPTWFDFVADSGKINRRGFCPTCGTSLFNLLEAMPEVLGIKAGTMDEPGQYQPAMDIFTASAQPWDAMSPKLPKFERMPAM